MRCVLQLCFIIAVLVSITRSSSMLQPGNPAPDFSGDALIGKDIKKIQSNNYLGEYVLLIFYPFDFTFVCPTEIIAFNDRENEFSGRGCRVIVCSTDSVYTHLAWTNKKRSEGGLGPMKIPMLSDKNMSISRSYGVLNEDGGFAFRGTFLIDAKGILRYIGVNDLPVGRSVEEAIRLLDAFKFHEENGDVCPVNWKPNSKTIKPTPEGSKIYFANAN